MGSRSTAELDGADRTRAEGTALETATEVLLDETLQRYVHTPTLGVHVGYRFF